MMTIATLGLPARLRELAFWAAYFAGCFALIAIATICGQRGNLSLDGEP